MCCGHQHENVCCRKTTAGIVQQKLEFRPLENPNALEGPELEVATVPLDVPPSSASAGAMGLHRSSHTRITHRSFYPDQHPVRNMNTV